MARVCRYCRQRCRGECSEARAAHERFAARQRAALEAHEVSPRVRIALDGLTPKQREDLFR